ncbi:hypothetical protein MNB_SV-9-352 [hydrothermal vent metagenome]|uniref:Uncharacterized protein n=1 Tax=hydrothermal vent metagenome TaxID=652676 RepID=A0A1W1BCE4_9ZZZZ
MNELERIEALEREIRELKGLNIQKNIKTFSYSQITLKELRKLISLKKLFDNKPFDKWFSFSKEIGENDIVFLVDLLSKYGKLIKAYKEETLKANFIIPIINRVNFFSLEMETSPFYEEVITYENENFIFTGTTDFIVSKGLEYSEKPYFFIQEFKKGIKGSDPEPQLLAELISAVELNNETSMKGAYIIGAIWNFVILEKLGKDEYRYFVSDNFDSTKIDDLKGIYRNLIFVKEEIIEMVRGENIRYNKIVK